VRVRAKPPSSAEWAKLPTYYGQKDPALWQYVSDRTYEVFDVDAAAGCCCLNVGGILVWFLNEWLIREVGYRDKEAELAEERAEGQRQIDAVNKKRDDMLKELFSRKKA